MLPPELGGPATFVPRLATSLTGKGHAVSVLSYADDPSAVPRYAFPVSVVKRRSLPLRLLSFFSRCVRLAAHSDLVLVCEHPALLSVIAARALRRPVALRVMVDPAWELSYRFGLTSEDPERFASSRHGVAAKLIDQAQRFSLRRAELVVAVSRHLAETAERLGAPAERIFVSYNLPPPLESAIGAHTPEARRRLGIDPDAFVLLVVSRLVNWKGVDTVLSILGKLPDRHRLYVLGDGPAGAELRELTRRLALEGRVKFVGNVDGAKVALYMKAADVLVLNSLYEGLSHVLLEAMVAGLPIVASDIPGNRELISHEDNGLLFPHDDPERLQRCVRMLAERQELREQFACRSRERARGIREEHSLERLVARLERAVTT